MLKIPNDIDQIVHVPFSRYCLIFATSGLLVGSMLDIHFQIVFRRYDDPWGYFCIYMDGWICQFSAMVFREYYCTDLTLKVLKLVICLIIKLKLEYISSYGTIFWWYLKVFLIYYDLIIYICWFTQLIIESVTHSTRIVTFF